MVVVNEVECISSVLYDEICHLGLLLRHLIVDKFKVDGGACFTRCDSLQRDAKFVPLTVIANSLDYPCIVKQS